MDALAVNAEMLCRTKNHGHLSSRSIYPVVSADDSSQS